MAKRMRVRKGEAILLNCSKVKSLSSLNEGKLELAYEVAMVKCKHSQINSSFTDELSVALSGVFGCL